MSNREQLMRRERGTQWLALSSCGSFTGFRIKSCANGIRGNLQDGIIRSLEERGSEMNLKLAVCALASMISTAFMGAAAAQMWPSKPLRLVVGFAPGGSLDLMSRLVADKMSQGLGQPIVVDNRPGAGGLLGIDAVIKADPDGYTFGMLPSATLISGIFTGRDQNTDRDLLPLGLAFRQGITLGLNPAVPEFKSVRNVADLVRTIKAQPNKIFFGSIGMGSTGHLVGELMKSSGGLQWTHIPYKGQAAAFQEVMAGQAPIVMIGVTFDDPKAFGGRIVPVGVTSTRRNARLPDVPTLAESGFSGFEASTWGGFVAPARVPVAVHDRLAREFKAAFDTPDFQSKWANFTLEHLPPAEFAKLMRDTIQVWSKVIRDNNIKAE
jgi:tripartite-type tricarboxylate transporter receptor subunit TctC